MELGADRVPLHREAPLPWDEVLPGKGRAALKQLLKGAGREAAQAQQHPCPAAQVQVQPGDIGGPALAQHPAVFRPHFGQPQLFQLIGHRGLHPHEGGYDKL